MQARGVRPRVVLSRCLEVEACRYNGAGIRSAVVRGLAPFVEFVAVCPEVEIGLGVPRDPIRIERSAGEPRLVQPSTGRDLTAAMRGFAHGFAVEAGAVDGAILKSRSPSCGLGDVKVFAGDGDALETRAGTGMFAAVLRERFPGLAMEDEARLTEREPRRAWLTAVFASARRRTHGAGPPVAPGPVERDDRDDRDERFPPEVEAAVAAALSGEPAGGR